MELLAKQEGSIGNGASRTPILAQGEDPTAEQLKPSRRITSTGSQSILSDKPLSPAEGLSLLQTRFFDLQSLGFRVRILAEDGELYAAIRLEGHTLDTGKGHILLDGQPVVKG